MNIFTDSDESDMEYGVAYTIVIRRKRQIRYRPNFFNFYDDADFRMRFRLSKEAAWFVYSQIEERLDHGTRNNAVLPHQMFLLTLRFYATGSFQQTVGDLCGVSTSSASRAIAIVSHFIALMREKYILYPSIESELLEIQNNFFAVAKFPRVIGAIDCTHVKVISAGGKNSEVYRNRKGFFSVNVQTVADSNLYIRDIVARWPGSVHDSRIFQNSRIFSRLEAKEFKNAVVLADSGYKNTNVVLTPLLQCNTQAEVLYNESHIRTRNCVERSYGVWKRRFPVLSMGLRVRIEKVPCITVATAVLHNICCIYNDYSAPSLPPSVEAAVVEVLNVPRNLGNTGQIGNNVTRRTLVEQYFSNIQQ